VSRGLTRLATIAIAYGIAGDIASPAERGSYVGFVVCGYISNPRIENQRSKSIFVGLILHQSLDLCLVEL